MANETVEQIHDELKHDPLAPDGAKPWTHYLAERILAAHKREIAAKDKELLHLRGYLSVTGDCRKCEECGDETCPWCGEPDGCNNRNGRAMFLAGELVDPLKAKDAEIASLRALIRELADALKHELDTGCVCCLAAHQTSKCPHSVCDRNENRALVAKAREVVSKMETTTEVCHA